MWNESDSKIDLLDSKNGRLFICIVTFRKRYVYRLIALSVIFQTVSKFFKADYSLEIFWDFLKTPLRYCYSESDSTQFESDSFHTKKKFCLWKIDLLNNQEEVFYGAR